MHGVQLRAGRVGRVRVVVQSLAHVPAVVDALAGAGRSSEVDLLPPVLADVADREITGQAIEREAPWIAQPTSGAEANGLSAGALPSGLIRSSLPSSGVLSASVTVRFWPCGAVAAAAAVAGARVELAVRAELQLAAVVVRLDGVRDREDRRGVDASA